MCVLLSQSWAKISKGTHNQMLLEASILGDQERKRHKENQLLSSRPFESPEPTHKGFRLGEDKYGRGWKSTWCVNLSILAVLTVNSHECYFIQQMHWSCTVRPKQQDAVGGGQQADRGWNCNSVLDHLCDLGWIQSPPEPQHPSWEKRLTIAIYLKHLQDS